MSDAAVILGYYCCVYEGDSRAAVALCVDFVENAF